MKFRLKSLALLALPLALGACAVVPAGGPYYGGGVAVAPAPVVVTPAIGVGGYWGGPRYYGGYRGYSRGYYGRGWGRW